MVRSAQQKWDEAYAKTLEKSSSHVAAAKAARQAYDKVLKDYDRKHRES